MKLFLSLLIIFSFLSASVEVETIKSNSEISLFSVTITEDCSNDFHYVKKIIVPSKNFEFSVKGRSKGDVKVLYTGNVRNYYTAAMAFDGSFTKGENFEIKIIHKSSVKQNYRKSYDPFFKEDYLNYNEMKSYSTKVVNSSGSKSNYLNKKSYTISVNEDGLYYVDHYEFLRRGIDLSSYDPRKFRLFNEGVEIPIFINGESDGVFDLYDYIEFYGTKNLYRYRDRHPDRYLDIESEDNNYILVIDDVDGLRLLEEDVSILEEDPFKPDYFKKNVHFEEDNVRNNLKFVPKKISPDTYFYTEIRGGENKSIQFELDNIVKEDIKVKYSLISILSTMNYNIGYDLNLTINNKNFNTSWIGPEPHVDSAYVGQDYILEGKNEFNLMNINGIDEDILLNWFEVEYGSSFTAKDDYLEFNQGGRSVAGNFIVPTEKMYELSIEGFTSDDIFIYKKGVSKLTNFQIKSYKDKFNHLRYKAVLQDFIVDRADYLALSKDKKIKPLNIVENVVYTKSLKEISNSADYLIISSEEMLESELLDEYIERKESNQFGSGNIMTVDVNQILMEFSNGEWTGEALHDFFKYMIRYWEKPASYVLLIGNSSYDHIKHGDGDIVPLKTFQHFNYGFVASDYIYTTFDEEENISDMTAFQFYIGRLPVRTVNQLENFLVKSERYENITEDGPDYRNRLKDLYILTDEDQYPSFKNMLINSTSKTHFSDRMLLFTNEPPYQGGTATLIQKWDDGLGELNYFGHGAGEIWANSGLLVPDNVNDLLRNNYFPLIYAWTCFSGNFAIDPGQSADDLGLSAAFLFTYKKGGIGVVAPTGNSTFEQNFEIYARLNDIKKEKPETLGVQYFNSIYNFYLNYISMDDNKGFVNLYQYLILGDPTLKLSYPDESSYVSSDKTVVSYGEEITFSGLENKKGRLKLYNSEDNYVNLPSASELIWDETVQNGEITITIPDSISCSIGGNEDKFLTARFFTEDENNVYKSDYRTVYLSSSNGVRLSDLSTFPSQRDITFQDSIEFKCAFFSANSPQSLECFIDTTGADNYNIVFDDYTVNHETISFKSKLSPFPMGRKINYYMKAIVNDNEYRSETKSLIVPIGDLSHKYREIVIPDSAMNQLSCNVRIGYPRPYPGVVLNYNDLIVSYFIDNNGVYQLLGNDTLSVNLSNLQSENTEISLLKCDLPIGRNKYKIDINSDRKLEEYLGSEPPYDNNVFENYINNYRYIVTKEGGTMNQGVHSAAEMDNFSINISSNAISENSCVLILDTLKINRSSSEEYLQNNGISLGEDYYYGYKMELAGALNTLQIPADVRLKNVEISNSDTLNVSLFVYNDNSEKWERIPTKFLSQDNNNFTLTGQTSNIGIISVFRVDDSNPPIISMGVEGQVFNDGGFVPSKCRLLITAQDLSGVKSNSLSFEIDGTALNDSEFKVSDFNAIENSVHVSIDREFSDGDHFISIVAEDFNGNISQAEIGFKVSKKFSIDYHGNYPNPFKNDTVFCFKISRQAEKVTWKIYTVSGRLIREYKLANVINYSEIRWDGRDSEGDLVANGVYFYKLSVTSDGKNYVEKGKMAKLRK